VFTLVKRCLHWSRGVYTSVSGLQLLKSTALIDKPSKCLIEVSCKEMRNADSKQKLQFLGGASMNQPDLQVQKNQLKAIVS
jgi:hypothetical protein